MAEKVSEAILGKGTALMRGNGDGPPETFTEIAEVGDVPFPAAETEEVEATNQQSPAGFREFIAGLKDPGEMTFEVNWLPTHPTHVTLYQDLESGTRRNWQIRLPNLGHTQFAFAAWVKKVEPMAPVSGKLAANITLRVTGAITRGTW